MIINNIYSLILLTAVLVLYAVYATRTKVEKVTKKLNYQPTNKKIK